MHSHFPGGNGGVGVLLGMGPGTAKNICGSNEGCNGNKEPRCSGQSSQSWISGLQHNRIICISVATRNL